MAALQPIFYLLHLSLHPLQLCADTSTACQSNSCKQVNRCEPLTAGQSIARSQSQPNEKRSCSSLQGVRHKAMPARRSLQVHHRSQITASRSRQEEKWQVTQSRCVAAGHHWDWRTKQACPRHTSPRGWLCPAATWLTPVATVLQRTVFFLQDYEP